MRSLTLCYTALLVSLSTAACREDAPPTPRQPPPPRTAPAACGGERKVNDADAVRFFPADAGTFCLDPNGSDQAYGEGSAKPLDGICNLFDGECEIYRRHGVDRVVEARYVDGGGSGATIDVYLSRFTNSERAYAMFTKRVVGDGDPAHPDTPRALSGGGASALGIGNAYLWRGRHLAEITLNDTAAASAADVRKRADAMLPPLVSAFGDKLPGATALPAAAVRLPEEGRLPLGIRYLYDDLLGVEGTGSGAYGYYREGERRWRVLALVKSDVAAAKDIMKTFARLDGAEPVEGMGGADEALTVTVRDGGAPTPWLLARVASTLVGIGDEPRVVRPGMSPEARAEVTLSQEAKRARLRALLAIDDDG
ncbi:MAG: DUF6599 family protein [Myxococcota bacterium]